MVIDTFKELTQGWNAALVEVVTVKAVNNIESTNQRKSHLYIAVIDKVDVVTLCT